MGISKKTDYALRMLSELVGNPGKIISARAVAEHNGVPYPFARVIQHDLTRAGIIESLRGARGGMRMAVDPSAVSLLEIIEIVQGPITVFECGQMADQDATPCPRIEEGDCGFLSIWNHAENLQKAYYASLTLAEAVGGGTLPDDSSPLECPA